MLLISRVAILPDSEENEIIDGQPAKKRRRLGIGLRRCGRRIFSNCSIARSSRAVIAGKSETTVVTSLSTSAQRLLDVFGGRLRSELSDL